MKRLPVKQFDRQKWLNIIHRGFVRVCAGVSAVGMVYLAGEAGHYVLIGRHQVVDKPSEDDLATNSS